MLNFVSRRKSLDKARNDAARAYVRRVVTEDFDGKVSVMATAIDIGQSTLAEFLSGGRGAGMSLLDAVANYKHVSIDVVLGRAADSDEPYPNKRLVMATPEFQACSADVREAFENLERDDGRQSVVAWAWDLRKLMDSESVGLLRSRGGRRLGAEQSDHPADGAVAVTPAKS